MPPKNHRLFFTPHFTKDFKNLDAKIRERVKEALMDLISDPYQGKKLKNAPYGQWRIRVGDYRIRYDIEDDVIVLLRVRHRKDIYKN